MSTNSSSPSLAIGLIQLSLVVCARIPTPLPHPLAPHHFPHVACSMVVLKQHGRKTAYNMTEIDLIYNVCVLAFWAYGSVLCEAWKSLEVRNFGGQAKDNLQLVKGNFITRSDALLWNIAPIPSYFLFVFFYFIIYFIFCRIWVKHVCDKKLFIGFLN